MNKNPAADADKNQKDNSQKAKPSKAIDNMMLLQQKVDELTTAVQRERADAVNLRRQHEAQVAGLKNAIKANVVRDLLPVIDNFERALKHVPADLQGHEYVKGVEGVVKQFDKTLADLGVERIKTVGQPFDPRWHEAVMIDDATEGSQEIVSEELQAGYHIGDEVIRHAMVKVAMR